MNGCTTHSLHRRSRVINRMGAESAAGGSESRYAWRHMFVGREPDMAYLQERWDDAREGRPQVVVLLGESGLGKTRLVQEFYRWLSTAADPGGYWPEAFTGENASLDVNPHFPADHLPTAPIPWLWWGLRWTNPEGRNRVGEVGLRDYRHVLLAHTEPIAARRRLKQIAGTASLTAANLASNLIPFANLLFVVKDLHSLAGNIYEAPICGAVGPVRRTMRSRSNSLNSTRWPATISARSSIPRRRMPRRFPSSCCWTTLNGPMR